MESLWESREGEGGNKREKLEINPKKNDALKDDPPTQSPNLHLFRDLKKTLQVRAPHSSKMRGKGRKCGGTV